LKITEPTNFDRKSVKKLANGLALQFLPDHEVGRLQEAVIFGEKGIDVYSGWEIPEEVMSEGFNVKNAEFFSPLNILDYIYVV